MPTARTIAPSPPAPAGVQRPARRPRFGLAIGALSLALATLTAVILLRGDQRGVTPAAVSPAPAAVDVSTGATLQIRFARPMEPQTVEQRLRLEPPAEGSFQWVGSTVTFVPNRPLRPATEYTATLAPGVEEARGRASGQPYAWRFRTRPPGVVARRVQDSVANLWLLDPAGGPPRQLTREAADVLDFSLAPDGERLVYTRQDGAKTSLWILALATGATVRLSPDEEAAFAAPAWSPQGDLIVFERRQLLTRGVGNPKLFVARADGAPGGLIHGRGDEVGHGARWSPDGARLAFVDGIGGGLIVFDFTREVVGLPVAAAGFDWSPDGRRLVIVESVTDGGAPRSRLVVADAASGALTRLTDEPGVLDATPRWSPDGASIAFTRRPAARAAALAQPWVVDAAGGAARPLPEARAETTTGLNWSPDSRQVLLTRQPANAPVARSQLWVVDAAAGVAPRSLGDGLAGEWRP